MRLKALEQRGKRLIVASLRPLMGTHPIPAEQISPQGLQRILVVRQDERLGNLLLITPLLEALRRILPQTRICALISRRFADVFKGNPDLDEVLAFDKRHLLRNPYRLVSLVRSLRRRTFDLAIDCGPSDDLSLNNSLLTYLSGAPLRLGHLRGDSHLFLNLQVPSLPGERSEVDRHLDLLRFLFGDAPPGRLKMVLLDQERRRAIERRREWGLGDQDKLVGLHLGGRGRKQWGPDHFLSLARRLVSRDGVKVLLFWGPDEMGLVRQMEKELFPGLYIAPLLPVRDLAAQLEQCTVFVANDTGPMHLALAVGTPTAAIFLKPNYARYGPRGPAGIIIHRPDGIISVDDVHAAVRELLGRRIEGISSP